MECNKDCECVVAHAVAPGFSLSEKIHWRTDQIHWPGHRPIAEGDPLKAPQDIFIGNSFGFLGISGFIWGFLGIRTKRNVSTLYVRYGSCLESKKLRKQEITVSVAAQTGLVPPPYPLKTR